MTIKNDEQYANALTRAARLSEILEQAEDYDSRLLYELQDLDDAIEKYEMDTDLNEDSA